MSEQTLGDAIRLDNRYRWTLVAYPQTDAVFADLTLTRRRVVMAQLLTFLAGGHDVQVEKLLLALKYWGEGGRIASTGKPGEFMVRSDDGTHLVRLVPATCGCQLFRGTGKFTNKQGVCAHYLLALISAI